MYTCTHTLTPMMSKDHGREDTQGTSKVRTSTGNRDKFFEEKAQLIIWGQHRKA